MYELKFSVKETIHLDEDAPTEKVKIMLSTPTVLKDLNPKAYSNFLESFWIIWLVASTVSHSEDFVYTFTS